MTRICAVCGRPESSACKVDEAHIDSKGMGGDPQGLRADTTFLCSGMGGNTTPGTCHWMHHNQQLTIRRHDDGILWYCVTEEGAKHLKKRGMRAHAGQWRPADYEDFDPDTVDERPDPPADLDSLAVIEGELRELDETEGRVYRYKAVRLAQARDLFLATYGKEGGARFREWRAEALGLGKSPASKLLTVADNLGEEAGRDLPAVHQYALARAVKAGNSVASCLAEIAGGMPLDDFLVTHGLKRERGGCEVERVECPLGMTCNHPKEAS